MYLTAPLIDEGYFTIRSARSQMFSSNAGSDLPGGALLIQPIYHLLDLASSCAMN